MSFGMPNLTAGGSSNTQTLLASSSLAGAVMSGSSHTSLGGDQSKGMDVSTSPPGDANDSMQVAGETEPVGGNEGGADVSMSMETSPVVKEKRGKDSKDRKSKSKETAAQGKDSSGTSSNEATQAAVVGGLSTTVGSNESTLPLQASEEEPLDTKKRGTKAAAAAAAAAEPTTTAISAAVGTTADSATTTITTTAPPASKARRR